MFVTRLALLGTVLLIVAALTACGDNGDDDAGGGGDQSTPAAAADGDGAAVATASGDDEDDETSSGGGSIEIGELPPPGEAWLQVDGQEFVFLESEAASERVFHCEIAENMVTINFQSDENDMTVQGSNLTGEWLLMVNARPRAGEGAYSSSGSDFATEGQALVYEGQFSFVSDEDRTRFQDIGQGRVTVNCP